MRTPAHKALKKWLEAERGRASQLAAAVGTVRQAVARWKVPPSRPETRFWGDIEKATGGAVRAVDWATNDAERRMAVALAQEAA